MTEQNAPADTLFHRAPPPLSLAESEQRKAEGMGKAATKRESLLRLARIVAENIAMSRAGRTCTADDVASALFIRHGIPVGSLGPAAGSIFSGAQWEFTGERVRSRQPNNHARELKVWRLMHENEHL